MYGAGDQSSAEDPGISDDESESDQSESQSESQPDNYRITRSSLLPRKRKRAAARPRSRKTRQSIRHSERSTRTRINMEEVAVDDIFRSDSESASPPKVPPKPAGPKEVFVPLPRNNLFRARHVAGCETCGQGPNIAPLVYCQGCSLAYHKNCLGHRTSREHVVTRIGDEDFVLQCRRCVNMYRKKDATAPDLAICQDCHQPGPACQPFGARKHDSITPVAEDLINNARNVLFRCTKCQRAFHYHHLPPLSAYSMDVVRGEDETAEERFQEYSKRWLCQDCNDLSDSKVSGIVAWRPADVEAYQSGTLCAQIPEDDKQYLLKWDGQSYFRASWHSGAWTWGCTAPAMRKAFFKKEDGPKMRTEDAIPEEFLRIDIVLDVRWTSFVDVHTEDIDKARIKEVDKALMKYKGLGYEDAVWEKVPTPDDGDRWLDFVAAYNDWVAGRYIKAPRPGPLRSRLEKARATSFEQLEKQKQPDNLGGELMKYQMDGLNWMYYQWYVQKNCILADEMGLGKTMQVIGFMATLVSHMALFHAPLTPAGPRPQLLSLPHRRAQLDVCQLAPRDQAVAAVAARRHVLWLRGVARPRVPPRALS